MDINIIYFNNDFLSFKIKNKINDYYYDIIFLDDNFILQNQFKNNILSGNIKHPLINNIIKFSAKNYNINEIFGNINHINIVTKIKDKYWQFLKRRKFLNIYLSNFFKIKNISYNEKEIENLLKNYSNTIILRKQNPNLYWYIYLNNIKIDIPIINKKIIYTKNYCKEIALLYDNLKDFYTLEFNVYDRILYNGWFDELCAHMERNLQIKHTFESVREKALLCKTRSEFAKRFPNEYDVAFKRLNKLDEICSHMNLLKNIWTKEECHEKALLCKTRKEFQTKYSNFYYKAYKEKWLDEICSHMTVLINQYEYDRIIYAYIFEETKTIYIGLTKNFKIRHINRFSKKYKNGKFDSVKEYIIKTNLQPKIKFLTNFISAEKAQIKEQEFMNEFISNGWTLLNKKKAGSLGGSYQKILL